MEFQLLVLGVILLAAILGTLVGFGIGMIMLPVLLLAGIPLPATVFTILMIGGLTRLPDAWQARRTFDRGRVAPLVVGVVPGVLMGLLIRSSIDVRWLQIAAGLATLASVAVLACGSRRSAVALTRSSLLRAGALGGVLGPTTSLSGIPPALIYARGRVAAKETVDELSIYFVLSNALMLVALTVSVEALPVEPGTLVLWAVVAQLGTLLGARYAERVSLRAFRWLTLVMASAAGVGCLIQAL